MTQSNGPNEVTCKWWQVLEDGRLQCDLCPRFCKLRDGDRGFCFVRQNVEGRMTLTGYGQVRGLTVDPVEKTPLHHFLPGTSVLSFGTPGCNLGCQYCQNWTVSNARESAAPGEMFAPRQIADLAVRLGCRSVAFTYNDPIAWAEYAIDTAHHCHHNLIRTIAVTNGFITPAPREEFFLAMDAVSFDLKSFSQSFYKRVTLSNIKPVLDTLYWLKHSSKVWLEITNLVIPGENDSPEEIRAMCKWILRNLGEQVPIHFTGFHPAHRMMNHPPTSPALLTRVANEAREVGIKYVYQDDTFDSRGESTYCPKCGECLIERNSYALGEYRLTGNQCSRCDTHIPGVFEKGKGKRLGHRLPITQLEDHR